MISYGVLLLFLILIFIFVMKFISWALYQVFLGEKGAIYRESIRFTLLRDIMFMVLALCSVVIAHYYHQLDWFKTNIDNLILGMVVYIIVWSGLGWIQMALSFKIISQYERWDALGRNMSKLQDLKRQYENAFILKKMKKRLTQKMQFQMMRQEFINPVQLPTLTESFLRRDFNFAMYLGFNLSNFLSDVFSFLNLTVLVVMTCLLLLWKLINFLNITYGSIIVYAIPICSLLLLLLIQYSLTRIERALVSKIDDPSFIEFKINMDVRDPFDFNNLTFPPYLDTGEEREGGAYDDISSEESDSEFENNSPKQSYRSQCLEDSILKGIEQKDEENKKLLRSPRCCGRTFNRHERLFMFGSFGVFGYKLLIQVIYLVLVMWVSLIVTYGGFNGYTVFLDNKWMNLALMVMSSLVTLFCFIFVLPGVSITFTKCTSI